MCLAIEDEANDAQGGTGDIDIRVESFRVLNPAKDQLPFVPSDVHAPLVRLLTLLTPQYVELA